MESMKKHKVNETAKFTQYTNENFTKDDHIRLSKVFKELDRKKLEKNFTYSL